MTVHANKRMSDKTKDSLLIIPDNFCFVERRKKFGPPSQGGYVRYVWPVRGMGGSGSNGIDTSFH